MNITEANATNVVLRYLLGIEPVPDDNAAHECTAFLASKAAGVLHAGITPEVIDERWPHVIVAGAGS